MGEINGWSVIERSFHNTKKRLMFTRCSTATSPPNCTVFVKFLTPQQILHSHPIRFISAKKTPAGCSFRMTGRALCWWAGFRLRCHSLLRFTRHDENWWRRMPPIEPRTIPSFWRSEQRERRKNLCEYGISNKEREYRIMNKEWRLVKERLCEVMGWNLLSELPNSLIL